MSNEYYKMGSWNVICDICGKKRKREECKKTWDGFIACIVENCWYPKHPNDLPRKIIPDGLPVPDARPDNRLSPQAFIPFPPITRWEDPGLTWESLTWRWDDDPSQGDYIIN